MKVLQGTARADRMNPDEPMPEGLPDKPEFADPACGVIWDELFPMLERMQVLTEADGQALALLCEWQATYDKAERFVSSAESLTFETSNGYAAQIPEFSIMKAASDKVLELYRAFGMTPASRTKVSKVDKSKRSKLSKYVGKTG